MNVVKRSHDVLFMDYEFDISIRVTVSINGYWILTNKPFQINYLSHQKTILRIGAQLEKVESWSCLPICSWSLFGCYRELGFINIHKFSTISTKQSQGVTERVHVNLNSYSELGELCSFVGSSFFVLNF